MLTFERILSEMNAEEHPLFTVPGVERVGLIWQTLRPFSLFAQQEIARLIQGYEDVLAPGSLAQSIDVYIKNLQTITTSIVPDGVDELTREEWLDLIAGYPSAERMIISWTDDFVNYIAEVVRSLKQCYHDLGVLGIDENHGRLRCFFTHDADIHEGKYVNMLELENGQKLVYKSRFPDTDILLETVTDKLTDLAGCMSIRFPGWIRSDEGTFYEFIQARPLEKESEFADYFFRFGFMLFVQMILGACDYHAENIMADGAHPVAIDTETVANEHVGDDCNTVRIRGIGMLPFLGLDHGYFEISDAACGKSGGSKNLPHLESGEERTGYQYRAEIEQGFITAYNTAMKNRELLCKDKELRQSFCCHVRYLIQNTAYYQKLLTYAKQKQFLAQAEPAERSMEILREHVERVNSRKEMKECFSKAEEYGMTYGYIPKIVFAYEDPEHNPLFDAFCKRLDFLNEVHRDEELGFIHSVLHPLTTGYGADKFTPLTVSPAPKFDLESISKVAEPMIQKYLAAYQQDKFPDFVICGPKEQHFYINPGAPIMPECAFGMAPFIGAWYKLTGSAQAEELLKKLTEQVKESFDLNPPGVFSDGLVEGKSGILLLADLMCSLGYEEDYALIRDTMALTLQKQLPRKSFIIEYKACSLFYGEAGIFLALQKLKETEHNAELLESLEQLAKRIMDDATPTLLKATDACGLGFADRILALYLWKDRFSDETKAEIEQQMVTIIAEKYNFSDYTLALLELCSGRGLREPVTSLCEAENLRFGNALSLTALTECGYEKEAIALAQAMLYQMQQRDEQGKTMLHEPENVLFPSFFYGYGGVLYALLRVLEPSLPAVFKN